MKRSWVSIITNNLGYKIISVLIAIVIWYAVTDINDPVKTETYTCYVEVVNGSYIENGKQIYRIAEEYKTVKVYVKANRSVLSTITEEDIQVIADLTQIVDLDRDPVMVPLQVYVDKPVNEVTLSRTTIPVEIENIATKEFQITVSTGDTSVDKDYEIGTLTPSPTSVSLTGPESIINDIESVVAKIDVTGMKESASVPATLTIMDKSQNELSELVLSDDITWNEEVDDISVYVDLWKKRSGVAIEAHYSGTTAPGYQVSNIATTPEEITVAGTDEALEALEEEGNTIVIPGSEINVDGIGADQVYEVEIIEFLPDDTKLSSSMPETVLVYVSVLPVNSREISVDVDKIKVKGLASNLTVSYDNPEITVIVMAIDTKLASLTEDDIKLSIDVTGKTEGDYVDLPVEVELPADVSLVTEPTITVHLKEKPETTIEPTPTPTPGEENTNTENTNNTDTAATVTPAAS